MDAALEVLAGLVLEDGRRWGDAAHPWQWADARAVLDLDPAAPRLHFLTRPRGASKTTDLAGVAVAALLEQLPPGGQAVAAAADRDQAALLVREVAGFVQRTPGLAGALEVGQWQARAHRGGATLAALAADGPSAYGLRPYLAVVDELAVWASTAGARQVWEAVASAVPKVPGGRLAVITSAGAPGHWSYKVLGRARKSRAWRTSELAGPCPWIEAAALEEQRALLAPSVYARLHENKWTAPEGVLASVDDLRACVTLDGAQAPVPGTCYLITLDVGLVHDRTVAAVTHREASDPARPVVVLDRLEVWAGSRSHPVQLGVIRSWVQEASRVYNGAVLRYDPFQAVGLTQDLEGLGVATEAFTFSSASVGRLASALMHAIRDRRLALPDDAALLDELANVRLRETSPGVLRLDHEAGQHDDRAIALALACDYWRSGAGEPGFVFADRSEPEGVRLLPGGLLAERLGPDAPVWDDDLGERRGAVARSPYT